MERCKGYSQLYEHAHPFVHEVKQSTALKIRGVLLGLVLFPIRITLTILFFLLMWPIARLRLAGLSDTDRARPVDGWRRWLFHPIMLFLSRAVFFSMGFLWIKVKGRQAGQNEAAVLAVAPHSGFLDMLVLCVAGLPTVVSRSENTKLPVIGALLEFNQSVLVSRKDPESRRKCVSQIKERLTSNGYWPQMLMFPEGTTTNGQALIKFKPGAFLAGVPVQPVLLRYPNRVVRVMMLQCLWYTASQLYRIALKTLGVPATSYVMEGSFPVTKLGGLSLPLEPPAGETLKMLRCQGTVQIKAVINTMIDYCHSGQSITITVDHLTSLLGLTDKHTAVKICSLYSKNDMLDLRQFCLSVCVAARLRDPVSLLHTTFTLYDSDGDGLLSAADLSNLMGALVGIPQYNVGEIYSELTSKGQGTEAALYDLLTTHPTFKMILNEYFQCGCVEPVMADGNHNGIQNGKTIHNNGISNGNGVTHTKFH
uniref:EF-hand domain-containing protein n=1 Tax=Electrophorus electricus TaxID=8005 RepID=A0AAY5EWM9_ELEEL